MNEDQVSKEIKYPATCVVHTPGGPISACEKHAGPVQALMRMMGAHVTLTELPEPTECDNCVNKVGKP